MPRSPIAKTVPELVDQLLAPESASSRQELIENIPEICNREIISGIADAVNRIAREDPVRAERLADVAGWLADLSGDLFCRARIRRAAGNLDVLRGNNGDAIETFQKCIEQFSTIGEEIEVAATLSGSLLPLIYLGRYSEALERARQARDIAERYKDDLLLARLDINVGNILHRQDRFAEALFHYNRGLAALDRLGQKRDCVIAWTNLAVVHTALNDFVQAEKAYQKARALALFENMPSIVAQVDYNIAYLYYRRGDYTQAIQLYQQTREYCQRVDDQYSNALCDLDQAEMYLELHLNREGTQLAEQAVGAFEKLELGYEAAKATAWLGIGAHQSGKPFVALDFFAKAQEKMRGEQNAVWVALLDFYRAIVFYQEGRFNEALRSCAAAHTFFSHFPNAGKAIQVQLLRATLHLALREQREAEDCCTRALESAGQLESPLLLTQAYAIRGRIAQMRGSIELAIDSYKMAVQSLEKSPIRPLGEESKLSLSRNRLEVYETLVGLMASGPLSAHAPEATLAVIEKAKSRELAELLAFRANSLPAPSRNRSGLVEQVRSLRTELSWYYGQIDEAETGKTENSEPQALGIRSQIRQLEERLRKTLGEIRPFDEQFFALQNAGTIPLDQIREMIREDEIIMEFYESHGLLYASLFSTDDVRIIRVARTETIRNILRTLRSHFSKIDRKNEGSTALHASLLEGEQEILFALHRELIHPIRKHICGQRLIIVPHGPLHYVPFHALFSGSRYLIEDHVISYAGSASQYYLSSLKQIRPAASDLIIGRASVNERQAMNPGFEPFLPNARSFASGRVDVELLERYGSKARFIHVESRLRLRRDNPLFSTLMIGNSELSILDMYHLRLPCSLIGLSGTGPGVDSAGNGNEIHTLAQGLEYAGVQTVLMPLWNVADEPSSQFLKNFYSRASAEGDKPLAFQQAITATRERFRHPYQWGSFVLRGGTGRGVPKSSLSTDGPL